ncbi:hypothetical protein NDU88_008166 [Pleurodeles waltl]|uniref:Uncharacterized protein n=1 Tax=Pleurodeles waltl TaxID=8319 RepID=A0AAV7U1X8_PLEWA|nr:hypothetical protein NDU88_008166 [Pleurodeles waltl]
MASPPPPNSSLPGGLQKETTHASIAAAAEAAPSPTQQPSPERPRHHLRTAPSLVGFRRRLPPASIAAAAEAAPSPTQHPSPEQPRRHLRTAPTLVGFRRRLPPASIAATAEAAPSPAQQPSPERPRRHLRRAPSLVGFRRRLPLHPLQPQQRPLLLLHSSQVLNGLLPPLNSSLPGGLQKETTPASIAAAAEAAPSPTQQPSPERPPATSKQLPPWWASEVDYPPHPSQPQRRPLLLLHSMQVLNDLAATSKQRLPGGLQKETTPASIRAAAEAAPSPTQQPSPERPRRHLRTAPSLVGFRRRLPLHASQPQRRPLLLLHSSQVLNGLLPPPNSSLPGGVQKETIPCIHCSRSGGRSFSYTAAKS